MVAPWCVLSGRPNHSISGNIVTDGPCKCDWFLENKPTMNPYSSLELLVGVLYGFSHAIHHSVGFSSKLR